MTELPRQPSLEERLRDAASETMARGADIRDRVSSREFSGRFAQLASGVLAGLADALRAQRSERDTPPQAD